MAQINRPTDYFTTTVYTGNGSTLSISSLDFSPDFVWIKRRDAIDNHALFDSVRGATKILQSNVTNAEATVAQSVTSFDSNGFTVGTDGQVNTNTEGHVAWSWRGSDSSPATNNDGSITSQVSANTTSGFSIVSYTGTGATATVGHGLSQTPEMVIVKLRSGSGTDWITWGSVLGGTVGSEFIKLNNTGAKTTGLNSSWFNNTAPTSSVFTVGTQSDLNGSGSTYIGYCFHSVKGYSKFGSYTGNGSTDGTFVYTGFKPAFVLSKCSSAAGEDWNINDNERPGYNVIQNALLPNSSSAEVTASYQAIDILSNGFKWRGDNARVNGSGNTYIYMAIAEQPLVTSTGIPATAR